MSELPEWTEVDFFGTTLMLSPLRVAYLPKAKTLLAADLHWGKEATFQKLGIPIPSLLRTDLSRLSKAVWQSRCERLVVLGDLLHAREGRSRAVSQQIEEWRAQHAGLRVDLVEGNHDRTAGPLPSSWDIARIGRETTVESLRLVHIPDFSPSEPTLAGHLHPKLRITRGPERVSLPCFWLRGSSLVLPAFSSFIDHEPIVQQAGDEYFVIAENSLVRFNHMAQPSSSHT